MVHMYLKSILQGSLVSGSTHSKHLKVTELQFKTSYLIRILRKKYIDINIVLNCAVAKRQKNIRVFTREICPEKCAVYTGTSDTDHLMVKKLHTLRSTFLTKGKMCVVRWSW
jgi:hypothetical protein